MPLELHQRHAEGAYTRLQDLIDLRHPARKLNLAQRKRALSQLSGDSKANFRGRGIDFEEVRSYQPGDDIRTIDWRVTARTGSAHTKMFREERERPVLVVADQRRSMFFGSQACCKSVLAAHFSALLCWAALQQGDRVGGLVFNENEHQQVRPRRSRRSVLAMLHHLQDLNTALPLESTAQPLEYSEMLVELRRIARPGCALFLVSDFYGALAERSMEHLYQLSRHTEVTAIHCSDPLEAQLPERGTYAVTDGENHTRLYTGDRQLRRAYKERYLQHTESLKAEYAKLGIPVIQASTVDSPLACLHTYYGDPRQGSAGP